MFCFHAELPLSFHNKEEDAKENKNPSNSINSSSSGKGKCKGKKKESNNKKIKNNDQVTEFKMANGKTWKRNFQGKFLENRVKFIGTFMCPCFHTKGECWSNGCKYKKSHIPADEIQNDKKQAYLEYMAICRRKYSIK